MLAPPFLVRSLARCSPSSVSVLRLRTRSSSSKSGASEFLFEKPGVKSKFIDGKALSSKIQSEIKVEVEDMVSKGYRSPNLTVVLVGEDPPSHTYVRNKVKTAHKVGMKGDIIRKPDSITESELLGVIRELNSDPDVDGILVQLPLPKHINEKTVCQSVNPEKDVDGFHMLNIGSYCMGQPTFIPATPLGILEMLKRCEVETFGKTTCIAGRSKNIGFTLNALLQSDAYFSGDLTRGGDSTTIMCHRYTPPEVLRKMTLESDIVISATGIPGLIKGDMVKEGATVIDVGITRVKDKNGKNILVGDVDCDEVSQVSSLITPVPGGVGPMTVTMVLRNTLYAAGILQGLRELPPVFHSIRS